MKTKRGRVSEKYCKKTVKAVGQLVLYALLCYQFDQSIMSHQVKKSVCSSLQKCRLPSAIRGHSERGRESRDLTRWKRVGKSSECQTRLSALSLLAIEHEVVDGLDFDDRMMATE
ncbi:unnamed protein product [Arctogadus glacialis]